MLNYLQLFADKYAMASVLFFLFFYFPIAEAKIAVTVCPSIQTTLRKIIGSKHADEMLDVSNWVRESRRHHFKKLGDPTVNLSSIERARKYAYEFPGLTRLGFGPVNKIAWKRVYGRMEVSRSLGKFIGWERKLPNGNWARVRIDYSPSQGAHYNIEVRVKDISGVYESHNLAVAFSCAERPCTEADYAKMLERME